MEESDEIGVGRGKYYVGYGGAVVGIIVYRLEQLTAGTFTSEFNKLDAFKKLKLFFGTKNPENRIFSQTN